jgi:hypothetical protein
MIPATSKSRTAASSVQAPDDNMQREDTDPWYRQFWPWFIMALPASAVVAGLYTLWLAGQTTDSLVIRSDDGIDIVTERNTLAEQTALRLGIRAVVNIESDTGAVVVTVSAPPDTRLSPSLELQLRHPTMASRDAVIDLHPAIPSADGEPSWAGHFQSPPAGRYYLFLSPGDTPLPGDAWRLSGVWSGQATLRLDPAIPDRDDQP